MDFSNKSVCVRGTGESVELAIRLSKEFGKVYYYTDWKREFSLSTELRTGFGLPNVERVEDFWDFVDEDICDLYVYPSIQNGDEQQHLLNLGKRVFGSRHGDDFELFRGKAMDTFKKLGLPVAPHDIVKGIYELREYLKKNDDVYVKICKTRGDTETFHSWNYDNVDGRLTQLEHRLGPEKFTKVFTVFKNLEALEIGMDGFCIDGQYPDKTLYGIEIKDKCYLGKFVDYKDIPTQLLHFNEVISDTMKKFEYRNFFAYDVRITKEGIAYPTDICARIPWPSGDCFMLMYDNLAEILWEGAVGNVVTPKSKFKYAGAVGIENGLATANTVNVQFPEKYRDNIKLRHVCKIKNLYYVLLNEIDYETVGTVCAVGNTKEEVIKQLKDISKEIHGTNLSINTDALDKEEEEMEKVKEYGVKTFD